MLLAPDNPTTTPTPFTRHDSVFVLLLVTLLLATSTFFAPFSVTALVAGLLFSVVIHRAARLTDMSGEASTDRMPIINIAAIHIGGDAGGLIFVLGSIAILALGLPTLRWFLIGSVAVAAVIAVTRLAWASSHPSKRMPSVLSGIAAFF